MQCLKVTVVVCTFNRAELLRAALTSLYALETGGRLRYEVLVVDNASSDATPEVIAQRCAASPVPMRGVRESRPGVAAARNRGIAAVETPWIAFFDDDQQAEPRWLLELAKAAEETGGLCLGGPAIPLLPPSCPAELVPALQQLTMHPERYPTVHRCRRDTVMGTGNIMIHRDVFQRIGTFNETLREAGEDSDLCWRMHEAGIELWHVPQARVLHSIEPSRVEEPHLRWTAQRAGLNFARHDLKQFGALGLLTRAAGRLALLLGVRLPRYLWAVLRRDAGEKLLLRCRVWRNKAYFRATLHLLAPALFPQRAFVAALDFRSERDTPKNDFAALGTGGSCSRSSDCAPRTALERSRS